LLADVYEKDLAFIKDGQPAEIEFPYADRKAITGRVDFFYPTLNPQTRTGQVRIELPNPGDQIKPDQYLNVKIQVEKVDKLVVPSDAVLDTGEQRYVFVDLGDGYFEPREVRVAMQTADGIAIEEGLNEGERVVTAANFLLDSESKLKGVLANMGKPKKTMATTSMAAQNVSIELLEPKTGKSGDNQFVVSIKDKSGNPVTEAEVQVTLSMPAMGSMPPMSSNGTLLEKGKGVYSGTVNIPMAWTWDTRITVRKNGQILGTKQTSVTAR
jgi:membrane fusion protein, copper/silver efflux system